MNTNLIYGFNILAIILAVLNVVLFVGSTDQFDIASYFFYSMLPTLLIIIAIVLNLVFISKLK